VTEGPSSPKALDLDGDGETSAWEVKLCHLCLLAAIAFTFGKETLLP